MTGVDEINYLQLIVFAKHDWWSLVRNQGPVSYVLLPTKKYKVDVLASSRFTELVISTILDHNIVT